MYLERAQKYDVMQSHSMEPRVDPAKKFLVQNQESFKLVE